MAQPFAERLFDRINNTNSRVCLGIDPRPGAHPLTHPAQVARAVVHYFQAIIQATQGSVACYKLQSGFFEALGVPGLIALAQLIADVRARGIPVILDAKRGDIGAVKALTKQLKGLEAEVKRSVNHLMSEPLEVQGTGVVYTATRLKSATADVSV